MCKRIHLKAQATSFADLIFLKINFHVTNLDPINARKSFLFNIDLSANGYLADWKNLDVPIRAQYCFSNLIGDTHYRLAQLQALGILDVAYLISSKGLTKQATK